MAAALKKLVDRGRAVPGRLRRRDAEHRLARPARPDRRGPAVAGAGAQRARGSGGRRVDAAPYVLQDDRRPASSARSTCCACSRARITSDSTLDNKRTHAKERVGQLLRDPGQGAHAGRRARPGRHRRGRQAEGDRHRRRAGRRRHAGRDRAAAVARRRWCRSRSSRRRKGDEEKMARRCGGSPRRIRRSTSTATRRPARLIVAGLSQMHVEVTRRAGGAPVRRRGRDLHPPRVPVPRDDPQAGARPGPLQEADRRPRPVRRLPHRDRAAARPRGLRVRRQDRRRRDPAGLPAGGGQGHPGGDAAGRARRAPGGRHQGDARRRLLPHRRLVGDGVQDRRLDGVQEGRTPRPTRCCSSRSCGSRSPCPRRTWAT